MVWKWQFLLIKVAGRSTAQFPSKMEFSWNIKHYIRIDFVQNLAWKEIALYAFKEWLSLLTNTHFHWKTVKWVIKVNKAYFSIYTEIITTASSLLIFQLMTFEVGQGHLSISANFIFQTSSIKCHWNVVQITKYQDEWMYKTA